MSQLREISTLEVTVGEDEPRLPPAWRRFFVFDLRILSHLLRLWDNRYLLYALTVRGIRGRYKQSLLGTGWALLTPAAMTAVFTYVFSRAGLTGKMAYPCPFVLYALCMLTFWNFFQRGVSNGSTALVSNMDLVTKVYFPREVLPIASVLMNLVDWALAFAMFLAVAVGGTWVAEHWGDAFPNLARHFSGAPAFGLHLEALWTPVFLGLICLFVTGLVFFASALQVYFRDMAHLINLALFLWLFLTPVLYPLKTIAGGRATTLIVLNPMTGLLEGVRLALISGRDPWERHVAYGAICALVVFLLGYSFFKHEERYFADVV